jgi:cysteine desulfurase/selenocysteine lyase
MTTTPADPAVSTPVRDGAVDPAVVARMANALYRSGLHLEPRGEPGGTDGGEAGEGPPVGPVGALRELPGGVPHIPLERDGPLYFLAGSSLWDGGGAGGSRGAPVLDVAKVRRDFPALHQSVNGRPLVWLDNAATTHKPRAVIDAVGGFYRTDYSNVHRGAHELARRATDAYEEARARVQRFVGAGSPREIVWVRGTTEAVNLVAQTYGRSRVGPGDEVIVSGLEHHSNIVPWQMLCEAQRATLRVIPVDDRGELALEEYAGMLCPRTRIVAVTHVSNVVGTVVPLRPVVDMAHAAGAAVLVDGAQAVQHMPVDVKALGADFYAFSGHKLFGPTGIGVLWGRLDLLEEMPPWQGGGSMIDRVAFEGTTYAPPPAKFEAGTGSLAGAVGLGAALDYLGTLGLDRIARHERKLIDLGAEALGDIRGLRQVGTSPTKVSTLTFDVPGVPAEAVGAFLDAQGIAVRAGHHCAQPLLARFGLTSAVRPSVALYNTVEEIQALASAVERGMRTGWRSEPGAAPAAAGGGSR